MEDKLLKMVINLHYHDRPKIVADATKVMQDYYNKKQTNSEYDEVLKTLHELMNDLPSNILLYFLTTVPLPKEEGGSVSTFSELMKKSRISLLDNMQSVLTDYINSTLPPLTTLAQNNKNEITNQMESEDESTCILPEEITKANPFKRMPTDGDLSICLPEPIRPLKRTKKQSLEASSDSCLKLVEICAQYVILNLNELRRFYDQKNKDVWSLVNRNVCNAEDEARCYEHIQDINRKLKWLRMIEAGHISVDVIKELYGDSEIFLKERHLFNIIDESAFTLSKELEEAIDNFVSN